jgi:Predicted signal transduction protein
MPLLQPAEFKRYIQTMVALGATATVLVKVVKLAKDPNSDLASICDLLKNDGPLVGDIIRISNSFYYATDTPHSNLHSAVNYIGLREVIRVVNLSLSRQLFARDLVSYGIPAQEYWSSSVAAALVMEALARQGGFNGEDAYTIGILHAVGRVLIDRVIQEKAPGMRWDGVQPLEEWEQQAVGFDFAEAGAMLAERWLFPIPTCDVIRCQLNPEFVFEPVSLIGALQFTRRLLALTGTDFTNKGWQIPENDPYAQAAGLTPTFVDHMVADCEENFQQIRQTIEM